MWSHRIDHNTQFNHIEFKAMPFIYHAALVTCKCKIDSSKALIDCMIHIYAIITLAQCDDVCRFWGSRFQNPSPKSWWIESTKNHVFNIAYRSRLKFITFWSRNHNSLNFSPKNFHCTSFWFRDVPWFLPLPLLTDISNSIGSWFKNSKD
jgi:hypothetical protein